MARTYLVFGDIDGKLDVLRVKCARRYSVRRLIEKYGRNATGAAQRRLSKAGRAHDRCDLVCPDLPKVI
jgi:hypothetical protein